MTFLKKAALAALALCLCLTLLACSSVQEAGTKLAEQVGQLLHGDVTGKIGETYRTEWFNFSVSSIKEVKEYAGYTPKEGNTLYDVVITELSTFADPIPMGTFDFYMDAESFDEYVFPMDPIDETMMPTEFTLNKDDNVNYHMVYEVPSGTAGLKLMYTELSEADEKGATFTIPID
ncbi:MAG: hypothetical protein LBD02_03875 [Christensenellaceae bacterium]|nr:hypothetical protein [Christensenellaceae bacterium]